MCELGPTVLRYLHRYPSTNAGHEGWGEDVFYHRRPASLRGRELGSELRGSRKWRTTVNSKGQHPLIADRLLRESEVCVACRSLQAQEAEVPRGKQVCLEPTLKKKDGSPCPTTLLGCFWDQIPVREEQGGLSKTSRKPCPGQGLHLVKWFLFFGRDISCSWVAFKIQGKTCFQKGLGWVPDKKKAARARGVHISPSNKANKRHHNLFIHVLYV